MEKLEGYLKEQSESGRLRSEGSFSINARRAQTQLSKYRLSEPGRYLLKLVQAAVSAQAPEVEIKRERFSTTLSFEVSEGCSIANPESLLQHLTKDTPRADGALHHMLVAISAYLATEHKSVKLELSGTQEKVVLELSPQLSVTKESISSSSVPPGMVRCCFSRSLSAGFFRFLSGGFERANDHKMLYAHCRHSPIPIYFDGRDLRATWPPGIAVSRLRPCHDLNLAEHYYEDRNKGVHHFSQKLVTYPWKLQEKKIVWRGAAWEQKEDYYVYCEAGSYSISVFDEEGKSKTFSRIPGFIPATLGLTINRSLPPLTHFRFVKDGVFLSEFTLDIGLPGLSVIGWSANIKVDLSEFSVVQDDDFQAFCDSLKPLYSHLLEDIRQDLPYIKLVSFYAEEDWERKIRIEKFKEDLRTFLDLPEPTGDQSFHIDAEAFHKGI